MNLSKLSGRLSDFTERHAKEAFIIFWAAFTIFIIITFKLASMEATKWI